METKACEIQLSDDESKTQDSVLIESVKPRTAGVICYSIEPRTGTIYLLLGKETGKKGADGRWCDFGGYVKESETVVEAASREFSEECMCVINLDNDARTFGSHRSEIRHQRNVPFAHYVEYVKQMLSKEFYTFDIRIVDDTIRWETGGHERVTRQYFLKRVPWQPNVREYFRCLRATLMRVQGLDAANIPNDHLVHESLRMHPAVTQCDPQSFKVNPDYLEKQKIELWSLDRLDRVCQGLNRYKHHTFRAPFVAALRVIIERLRDIHFCV